MTYQKCRLLPEPLRSLNSTALNGIAGTFVPFQISAANSPITNPSRSLIVCNRSGVDVTLSWDGINDHVLIPAGGSFIFDEQSNSVADVEFCTAALTQFYCRGVASTGLVYLSTFYAA